MAATRGGRHSGRNVAVSAYDGVFNHPMRTTSRYLALIKALTSVRMRVRSPGSATVT